MVLKNTTVELCYFCGEIHWFYTFVFFTGSKLYMHQDQFVAAALF